jgi:hypothetical protein
MKVNNYKTINKTEWQELATKHGIEWNKNSVVRYLVEKIAEKIGVDDKIVSDDELKKQVIEKINIESNTVKMKEIAKTEKKEVAKKEVAKKVVKAKSPASPKKEITKEVVVETPIVEKPQLTRLEELRLECESYGVAWAEGHSESNLEQVLNGVKGAGVQPISQVQTSITPVETINTNEAFEINSSNASQVAQSVSNAPQGNPAFNPLLGLLASETPVNGGYGSSNSYLDTYKGIYLNAIRGHWRVLSVAEINEMILRDNQTFTHQINFNPQQQNKVEIILIQDTYKVRIPSDNQNEWLDING